jgi:hypothetical protein
MYPKWFYTKLDPAAANGDVVAVPALAQFLRDYQLNGGYTPGPLFLAGLILGAAGSLAGMVRRRTLSPDGARLARASLLVTLSAIVLLISSDAFEFSWRYQLPAVILLPLGGALGLAALRARCPNWTLGIRSRSADLQADQVGVHDAARSHTCHQGSSRPMPPGSPAPPSPITCCAPPDPSPASPTARPAAPPSAAT